MAKKMSWTEDRVSLLTRLWGEGKTAAEIAQELGGVTRNAVIGKAHRLKLSGRISPIQQNNKKQTTQAKTPTPKKSPPKPIIVAKADKERDLVPLIDIKGHMCRWPVGDPQEEKFGFCGDRSLEGLPYCAEHAQVAYQAATRNRILKTLSADDKKAATVKPAERKKAAAG